MRYISKERLEELKKELTDLKVKRHEIAQRIEEAKAMGDLSENMEYQEALEVQAFNEGRVREIEQILKEAVLVSRTKEEVAQIGSTIKVKSDSQTREFIIVGSAEADPSVGKISHESPMGKAFLNHKINDMVEAETPRGKIKYKIISIS